MKKAIPLFAVMCLVVACSFGVVVSAEEWMYSKIDIADYLVSKECIGEDVNLKYDMPISPYTELWGVMADGTSEQFSSASFVEFYNEYGEQVITTWEVIEELGEFEFQNRFSLTMYGYNWTHLDVPSITGISVNGVLYPVRLSKTVDTEEVAGYTLDTPDYGEVADASKTGYRVSFTYLKSTNMYSVGFVSRNAVTDTFDVNLGLLTSETIMATRYKEMYFDMLLLGESYAQNRRVVDISDIRSGSGFTLDFAMLFDWSLDGNTVFPDCVYTVYYLDENFQQVGTESGSLDVHELFMANGPNLNYQVSFTVPAGAAYFYPEFSFIPLDVTNCASFTWACTSLTMSCALSALEDNSRTLIAVQQQLDRIESSLTPTPEQSDKAEQMEDAIGDAAVKVEDNNAKLDQLTPSRPTIETDLQLGETELMAVSPLITNIWSINGMNSYIGIVVCVATVAYIFFGKRDG